MKVAKLIRRMRAYAQRTPGISNVSVTVYEDGRVRVGMKNLSGTKMVRCFIFEMRDEWRVRLPRGVKAVFKKGRGS